MNSTLKAIITSVLFVVATVLLITAGKLVLMLASPELKPHLANFANLETSEAIRQQLLVDYPGILLGTATYQLIASLLAIILSAAFFLPRNLVIECAITAVLIVVLWFSNLFDYIDVHFYSLAFRSMLNTSIQLRLIINAAVYIGLAFVVFRFGVMKIVSQEDTEDSIE